MVLNLLAAAALAVWVYLIAGRGGFWLASERDDGGPAPATWPSVMTVIPARDEAESVGQTIASLLQQDYPGALSIVLVDDQSSDGTAEVARQAAAACADRLTIVPGAALPAGWTGKLWAMKQGVERALTGEAHLSAVYRRRYRLRPRRADAPRLASAGERAGTQFADGCPAL